MNETASKCLPTPKQSDYLNILVARSNKKKISEDVGENYVYTSPKFRINVRKKYVYTLPGWIVRVTKMEVFI